MRSVFGFNFGCQMVDREEAMMMMLRLLMSFDVGGPISCWL